MIKLRKLGTNNFSDGVSLGFGEECEAIIKLWTPISEIYLLRELISGTDNFTI